MAMPSKTSEILGQRFGRLVAVAVAGQKSNKTCYQFLCDCGGEKIAVGSEVKRGKTRSCGCLLKEHGATLSANTQMVGQRFGQLKVAKAAGKVGRLLAWECQCSCGKIAVFAGASLRAGKNKSCGCLKWSESLQGKEFGRLKVIGFDRSDGQVKRWKCLCDCGVVTSVTTSNLRKGNVQSCGCLAREIVGRNHRAEGHIAYAANPAYAARKSWLYLAEVAGLVDKIGIAFDVEARAKRSDYTHYWWRRQLTRAQCWAVEQVALLLTQDWKPKRAVGGRFNGASEQRVGWVLEDVVELMEELCDECVEMGWAAFYSRYCPGAAGWRSLA